MIHMQDADLHVNKGSTQRPWYEGVRETFAITCQGHCSRVDEEDGMRTIPQKILVENIRRLISRGDDTAGSHSLMTC